MRGDGSTDLKNRQDGINAGSNKDRVFIITGGTLLVRQGQINHAMLNEGLAPCGEIPLARAREWR